MARSDLGGGGQKASHRARAQGDEVSASLFTHLQFALQGFSLMKEARQIKRSHATLLSLSLASHLFSSLLLLSRPFEPAGDGGRIAQLKLN